MIFNDDFVNANNTIFINQEEIERKAQEVKAFLESQDIRYALFLKFIDTKDLKVDVWYGDEFSETVFVKSDTAFPFERKCLREFDVKRYGYCIVEKKSNRLVMANFKFEVDKKKVKRREKGTGFFYYSIFLEEYEMRYESSFLDGSIARKVFLKTKDDKSFDINFYLNEIQNATFYQELHFPKGEKIMTVENSPRTNFYSNTALYDFEGGKTYRASGYTGKLTFGEIKKESNRTYENPKLRKVFNLDETEGYDEFRDMKFHYEQEMIGFEY